jgi:hypothetical protein
MKILNSYWEKFKHKLKIVKAKRQLALYFPEKLIKEAKHINRESLGKINSWIDHSTIENSVFNYGIPLNLLPKLDLTIDYYTTYTDILAHLSAKLTNPIQYLEIGVSAGKNFWQLANFLQNARLTGMDIELINPVLESQFRFVEDYSWEGQPQLLRKNSSTSIYHYNTNNIQYHCMDEFDETGWSKMSGQKFNIFFHDPKALWFEYEMIEKYNLLDETEFVMMWDDLGGNMASAFSEIHLEMQKRIQGLYKYQFITNGWMNDRTHQIGIITNIKL